MAFRILYVENGDVGAQEDTYQAAYDRLRGMLEEHPELDDEIGIQPVDKDGKPIGEMTIGLEVAGQQLQLS